MVQAMSLAQKRAPFESIDTWEYYLGERCRRQLGFPCRVPFPPPDRMHGTHDLTPEDEVGVGRPADNLVMDENVDYSSWFAVHSVGKIVDLSRFLGGVETGAKVLSHWVVSLFCWVVFSFLLGPRSFLFWVPLYSTVFSL